MDIIVTMSPMALSTCHLSAPFTRRSQWQVAAEVMEWASSKMTENIAQVYNVRLLKTTPARGATPVGKQWRVKTREESVCFVDDWFDDDYQIVIASFTIARERVLQ